MLDKNLLKNFDLDDKEKFLNGLEEIIEHSYTLENEFKEIKAFLSDIIEFLPNALWVLREDGEIFLQNSEAKKISNLIDLIKDGGEIEFDGKIYLVKSAKARDKFLISATDITEQKRAERLASMGKVAAHLSHEIRNPIGSISILSDVLLNRAKSENRSIVVEIKKAIYRVERIIKSTLLFTKGVKTNPKPFNLKRLEESLQETFLNYVTQDGIRVEFRAFDSEIVSDFELLYIVLQNFLYNGVDAILESEDESGVVSFIYEKEGEFHTIVVKDSGKEIEDKNILYEPFATTKLKGTGLGLALSLEIIKAFDGKIELLDDCKGFKIWLK